MQDRDVPQAGTPAAFGGTESTRSVVSIAADFAALVAMFEKQLELVSPSDVDTRSHLEKAKTAAERGAKLSQELMGLLQAAK
jgi:hypothetical protein